MYKISYWTQTTLYTHNKLYLMSTLTLYYASLVLTAIVTCGACQLNIVMMMNGDDDDDDDDGDDVITQTLLGEAC